MTLVGWYAHHLGSGHVARALTVAPLMRSDVVVLSSAPRPAGWPADRWLQLPRDDDAGGTDHTAGRALHWAPLMHRGYGERMALIAEWIRGARPTALVVDVSAEVTLLARTLGVPVATWMGQALGRRFGFAIVGLLALLTVALVWLFVPVDKPVRLCCGNWER